MKQFGYEKALADVLQAWFDWSNGDRERLKRAYNQDKVGLVMRGELSKQGHWKNRSRGNPRKGYLVARKEWNREG